MKNKEEIILAIDPGFCNIGYSIVTTEMKVIDYGCCVSDHPNFFDKLINIEKSFILIFKKYKPTIFVFEEPSKIAGQNGTRINEVMGVLKLLCAKNKISTYKSYTPTQVKKITTGSGKADKRDIQKAVKDKFKLDIIPEPDHAADSIAVAYCYIKK